MATVHAVALPTDFRQGRKGGGVVPLLLGRVLVGEAGPELLQIPGPRHHRSHARTGQGVVETLKKRQGPSRRGELGAEQISAADGLHDRNANPQPLAGLIEGLPLGVHVYQWLGIVVIVPQLLHMFPGWQKIVAGVDAEHEHRDLPTVYRLQRHLRIVAGQADAANNALVSQGPGIV